MIMRKDLVGEWNLENIEIERIIQKKTNGGKNIMAF